MNHYSLNQPIITQAQLLPNHESITNLDLDLDLACQEITKYSTSVIYSEKTRIPDSVLCRSLVPTLPVPRLCITQITAIV